MSCNNRTVKGGYNIGEVYKDVDRKYLDSPTISKINYQIYITKLWNHVQFSK